MTATTTALYPDVVSTAIRVRTHTAEDRDQAVLTEMTLDALTGDFIPLYDEGIWDDPHALYA